MPQTDGPSEAFDHHFNGSSPFMTSLLFQDPNSARTLLIILASSNALAGAVTAAGIYLDCYHKSRNENPGLELKSSFWKLVGPAETFPFVLSVSIVGQGIVFAVVQAFGLQLSITVGSYLIIPYLYLTFGIDATIRALRPHNPFASRHKWGLPACLATPFFASMGTYLVARFISLPRTCVTSPFFFLLRPWGPSCFGIVVGIASALLLGSGVIFYRLCQVSEIGERQRMTASWTASLLVAGSLSMWHLSAEAMVIVNLSGIITGLLYVVLRSTKVGRTGPKPAYHESNSRWSGRRPRLILAQQMGEPPSMPATSSARRVRGAEPRSGSNITKKAASLDAKNTHGDGGQNALAATQSSRSDVLTTTGTYFPAAERKSPRENTYSLFPCSNTADQRFTAIRPATAREPTSKGVLVNGPFADEIPAPPTTHVSGVQHSRAPSLGSSVTVPIGLRISNMNEIGPNPSCYRARLTTASASTHRSRALPRPLTRPDVDDMKVHADVRGVKDKQLPPVPLSLTKKAPKKCPEAPQKQPSLPPRVHTPQRRLATGEESSTDGKDALPSLSNSLTENPAVGGTEWI
ncbi:hypothetical protein E4U21_001697 [Claviceps maximensis]|nr:hypothetical protein E4U21_001697 [Claviceps maximensis]